MEARISLSQVSPQPVQGSPEQVYDIVDPNTCVIMQDKDGNDVQIPQKMGSFTLTYIQSQIDQWQGYKDQITTLQTKLSAGVQQVKA